MSITATIPRKEAVKVTIASTIGTTLDFFDFLASGTAAAIVWPIVFFPEKSLATGILLSISVYVLGFLARPIGAFVFGHWGDKLGRKKVMIWTLVVMGLGSLGIALTPSYAVIGVFGAVLITVFRLLQGIGLGGEFGGGSTWVIESASKSKWRALWSCWLPLGSPMGSIAANVVFATMIAFYGGAKSSGFLDLGWRVPFLIGTVLVVFGIIIRMTTLESPIFKSMEEKKVVEHAPGIRAFREMPGRIVLAAFAGFQVAALYYVVSVFSQSYLSTLGLASIGPTSVIIGNLGYIITIIGGALLADKIGRRPTMMISTILMIIYIAPYFMLLNTKDVGIIYLAQFLALGIIGISYGSASAFFTEQFPARYRYSAAGFSYGFMTFLGAFNPIMMSYILTLFPSVGVAWPYMILPSFGYLALAVIGILMVPETRKKDMTTVTLREEETKSTSSVP